MTETPPASTRRSFWAELLRFLLLFKDLAKPQNLWLVAGLILVGMVAATGGLGPIETHQTSVPTAEPSTEITAKPFIVTVKRAFWTERTFAGLVTSEPGVRSLLLVVDITNTASTPVDTVTLGETFRIDSGRLIRFGKPAVDQEVVPNLRRSGDFQPATYMQPGLPTGLVLIWQQSSEEPVPTQIVLTLREHTWRASSLDGSLGWFDGEDCATVTVPVSEFQP